MKTLIFLSLFLLSSGLLYQTSDVTYTCHDLITSPSVRGTPTTCTTSAECTKTTVQLKNGKMKYWGCNSCVDIRKMMTVDGVQVFKVDCIACTERKDMCNLELWVILPVLKGYMLKINEKKLTCIAIYYLTI